MRLWVAVFILVIVLSLLGLGAALWLSQPAGPRSLAVMLHSALKSDYSADPRGALIAAVDTGIIAAVIRDQPASETEPAERVATVAAALQTPVLTITPLPTQSAERGGSNPTETPGAPPATNTPTASATVAPPTPTSSPAPTKTLPPTPTSTRRPTARPTATSTPAPTDTPPPLPATDTPAPPPVDTQPPPPPEDTQPPPLPPTDTPVPPPPPTQPCAYPPCGGGGYP